MFKVKVLFFTQYLKEKKRKNLAINCCFYFAKVNATEKFLNLSSY